MPALYSQCCSGRKRAGARRAIRRLLRGHRQAASRFILSLAAGVTGGSRPVPVPPRRGLPAVVRQVAGKRPAVARPADGKRPAVARPADGKRPAVVRSADGKRPEVARSADGKRPVGAGAAVDKPAAVGVPDDKLARAGARSALAREAREAGDGMSGSEPADGKPAAGAMPGALRAEAKVVGGRWAQTRMRSASSIAAVAVERPIPAVSSDCAGSAGLERFPVPRDGTDAWVQ
jgi:hypothetical protein